ncbi:hypothetical protein L6164_001563 [Bauhinia variegata]|uniref:Uncharacterized protein n=1 Tax=Bauhinia variegata TaxID=167791 RepID=A0ACB9Q9T4_BAUVA|nr:hypothetical protein L6164_001563 [Bauhinia variegata]
MSDYGKLETDVHINATAEQFHEIFSSRTHHIANVADKIKGVEMHEGDWGNVGSILGWNYVHEGKHCVAKELVEAIDPDKNLITFRILEGDLMEHYKSFKITIQVSPKDKGSVAHWTFEYEKKHGHVPDPHSLVELGIEMSKEIDDHLAHGKLETDVHINATAEQFHEIFSSRTHHIANVADKIKGVEMLEGEWGKVGSIIVWNYVHEGKHCVAKELVEAIDPDNNLITFKILEGDLMEHYKSFKITIQVSPKDKGSVAHWTFEYEKKHGHVPDPHSLVELGIEMSQAIDDYLAYGKLETDVHINATAEQFHEILCGRTHHIANISSDKVKGVDIHDGVWGKVGSIIIWNYIQDGKHCTAKDLVEAIDLDKKLFTLRVLEGDILEDYKSFKITLQVSPQKKGSVVHWTFEYEKKYGHVTDPHSLLQLASEVSKDIDAHLAQA